MSAIQEGRNYDQLTFDQLRGNLLRYEMTILNTQVGENKKKSLALKALSQEEDSDENGDQVGHIKPNWPKLQKGEKDKKSKKKQKAYISWENEDETSSESDDDEVANLCFMAIEEKEKMGKKTESVQRPSSSKNQGHLFRCLPTTVATMFVYLKENPDKRALVDQMGFCALSHLPNNNLDQVLLKHLFDRYDIYDNKMYSDAAAVKITTKKIGDALGLSSNGKTTIALQDLIKSTPLDTDDNRKLFMRSFICFIQKVFLLPNSTANIIPTALPTIFDLENIRSRNWTLHVHNFLLQELKKAKQNKTVAIHGCVYVLMIIYFHETHFGENSKEAEAQTPWLAYWTGETLKNRLK
ncbi:hypothetical protein PIB30_059833 [Stylosanthes scabra]|uniref:Uncharacterized protein n=1 Tax=Stylosanthes scabra TaxID=79078 RepID=A0ABU6UM11_9FABA|nr:hypothetical protein [Stylosanthes scabra]